MIDSNKFAVSSSIVESLLKPDKTEISNEEEGWRAVLDCFNGTFCPIGGFFLMFRNWWSTIFERAREV